MNEKDACQRGQVQHERGARAKNGIMHSNGRGRATMYRVNLKYTISFTIFGLSFDPVTVLKGEKGHVRDPAWLTNEKKW
jgi:hypothetical protein